MINVSNTKHSFFRLVFLLQACTRYLDGLLNFGRGLSSNNNQGNFNSVGLVVKKFWNKMVHLYSVLQQLNSEVFLIIHYREHANL